VSAGCLEEREQQVLDADLILTSADGQPGGRLEGAGAQRVQAPEERAIIDEKHGAESFRGEFFGESGCSGALMMTTIRSLWGAPTQPGCRSWRGRAPPRRARASRCAAT